MAGFKRRSFFDLNQAMFEGRVTDVPTLELHKRRDGVEVSLVRFQVVSNSSPYSFTKATYFRCYAYGIKAEKIFAAVKRGYSVFVTAETKSISTKADKKKGIPTYQLNEFEVRHLYIIGVPEEEDSLNHKKLKPARYDLRPLDSLVKDITTDELADADLPYLESALEDEE
jgi:hypothetical protein